MSDFRVDSCPHQKPSDSGKMKCVYSGRPYYFCKTNRKESMCPLGFTTTYDDPEQKPERPFKSSIEESIKYFHEHHNTTRWNLKNRMDSYQLFQQIDLLQFRYFQLALALWRAGKYKESHHAWGKHDAYRTVMTDIFQYNDGSGKRMSDDYRELQRRISEMETAEHSSTGGER